MRNAHSVHACRVARGLSFMGVTSCPLHVLLYLHGSQAISQVKHMQCVHREFMLVEEYTIYCNVNNACLKGNVRQNNTAMSKKISYVPPSLGTPFVFICKM